MVYRLPYEGKNFVEKAGWLGKAWKKRGETWDSSLL